MSDEGKILELIEVRKHYGDQIALDDVNLTIAKGEFLGIVGPSGSGKSTLLYVMGGLLKPTSGRVLFEGSDLYGEERALIFHRKRVGFVFQTFNLLNELTVLENVLLSMETAGVNSDRNAALEALEMVGMSKRWSAKPMELSVGERQRVAIARCIARHPSLIIADEPTGSLDTENKKKIMDIFHSIHENGKTLVVASHDISTLREADRIVTLVDGRTVGEVLRMEFREALQKAVKIEESSYELYTKVAEIAEDRSIKEFAKELAEWELSHKEKLLSVLEGDQPAEVLGKRMPQDLGIADLFEEVPTVFDKDVKLEELLKFGIAREESTAELYRKMKSIAEEETLIDLFERLELEEKSHKEKLEKIYEEMVLEGP